MDKNGKIPPTRQGDIPPELGTYLLLIHDLLKEKGYVRGVELSERLRISRPTVTRAMQRLAALGFARYERYRGVALTDAGKKAAKEARRRYEIIERFLLSTGVEIPDIQLQARRLEGFCTDEVLSALESAADKLAH